MPDVDQPVLHREGWDAYIYTSDPDTLCNEFKERGVSFVKELSYG